MSNPCLYLVVPCYNESEVLDTTAKVLGFEKLRNLVANGKVSAASRILFINDGSKDDTWMKICFWHSQHPETFSGLSLSRNRGHQNALLAGLLYAKDKADIVISLDADLQDDVDAIDEMIDKYVNEECDIVYGVRSSRKKDSFFKRFTAESFYKIMSWSGVEIVFNHADYRLMSKRALVELEKFSEVNLFLRGLVPLLGFKTGIVYYERGVRQAGQSKYPFKKMLSFAVDGITSFSVTPLRFITKLGLTIFCLSILMLIYFCFRWYSGETVLGWASLICSVWAIGGLILFCLGIIGEYIGKIYKESKHRPRFIIDQIIDRNA